MAEWLIVLLLGRGVARGLRRGRDYAL